MNLLWIFLFMLVSAYIDYEHLKDNDYIESHVSRVVLRVLFCVAVGYPDVVQVFGMLLFFSATFDNTLNMMRGKDWLHLGKTAKWDLFWRRRMVLYIGFIVMAFFISIGLLINPLINH